jgi:hypothetical protein
MSNSTDVSISRKSLSAADVAPVAPAPADASPINAVSAAYTAITKVEEPRSSSTKAIRAQYLTAARTFRDVFAEKAGVMHGTTAAQRAALHDLTLEGLGVLERVVQWLADLPSTAKIDPIQIGSVVRLTSRGTDHHSERYHGKGVVVDRSAEGDTLTVCFGKGETQSVLRKHLELFTSADKGWQSIFDAFGIDKRIR